MRLLFINTFSEPTFLGGAERTLKNLVDGMSARGHEVHVVSLQSDVGVRGQTTPDHTARYPVRNVFTPDGTRAHALVTKLLWHGIDIYNPIAARDLQREIAAFNPDIISCHNLSGWSMSAWDVASRNDVPVVQVLHDYYLMCVSGTRSKGGNACKKTCARCKVFRFRHRQKSAAAAAVVGISDHILSQFLDAGFFANAIARRIYNVERPLKVNLECLVYPEKPVFGFIGRISPHKGIETLLRAFRDAALPDGARLLVAGEGEPGYVAGLRRAYEFDDIQFLGHQPAETFFPRLSWSIVPSLSDEPLGRVVFESHGYGIPVIASRRGGIPEMIEHGRNGYLFEAGDEVALRELLELVSTGTHAATRREISNHAALFFDTERFLTEYEEVYRSLCDKTAQGGTYL